MRLNNKAKRLYIKITNSLLNNKEIVMFLSVLIPVGVVICLLVPYGMGQDEISHLYKAEALSNGILVSQKIGSEEAYGQTFDVYGGKMSANLTNFYGSVYEARADFMKSSDCIEKKSIKTCDKTKEIYNSIEEKSNKPISSVTKNNDVFGANPYSPVSYFAPALGLKVSHILNTSVGTAVKLARIFNFLLSALICAYAIRLLRGDRFRYVLMSLVLAPYTLIALCSLGGDSLLIALSVALSAVYYKIITKNDNKKLIYMSLVAVIIISLIKLPYILLSLPLILYTYKKLGLRYLLAACILIILPATLWNISTKNITKAQLSYNHVGESMPNPREKIKYFIDNPLQEVRIIAKSLAGESTESINKPFHVNFANMPYLMVISSYLLITTAILYSYKPNMFKKTKEFDIKQYSLALLALIIGVSGGIVASLYVLYNPVGNLKLSGIQGRYFIPLIPLISLLIVSLFRIRITKVSLFSKRVFLVSQYGLAILTPLWIISIIH